MSLNYVDYIIMAAFFAALIIIPVISALRSKGKGAKPKKTGKEGA